MTKRKPTATVDPIVDFAAQLIRDLAELRVDFLVGETPEQTAARVKNQIVDFIYARIPVEPR